MGVTNASALSAAGAFGVAAHARLERAPKMTEPASAERARDRQSVVRVLEQRMGRIAVATRAQPFREEALAAWLARGSSRAEQRP
jgi:hypothetical protein